MMVAHVITCLDDGGAEAVLYRLCLADRENEHVVVSLQGEGKYGPLLGAAGIAVHCLRMPRGLVTPGGVYRLARLLRRLKPGVVQTWMYHADLVGGLAARAVGLRRVFWGLHNTNLEKGRTKFVTILVARLNALLSHWLPQGIVSCSQKGVEMHRALGYAGRKFLVVPNGYDLRRFAPDPQARQALRASLGMTPAATLLGMVARFDPQKDHHTLITALGMLRQQGHDFRCLLVGTGMAEANRELMAWLEEHQVRDRVVLAGQRSDIPAVMNGLDVHVLSSAGEAFPNVLCEAMACGTPCVTTSVGDAALIVGDTGWVVPPRSVEALAQAMAEAISQRQADPARWQARKAAARQRILTHFSLERMLAGYSKTWREQGQENRSKETK